jgi:pimeloyl-ACP methyl ester carboxylesterase
MELAYEVRGEGPTLLLIHGAAEDARLLHPQAEALAHRGYRVITYDRRGTGRSTRDGWPAGGVLAHVRDAAGLIEIESAERATVLGFSSGGVLALALAAQHPELVEVVIAWEPPALEVLPDGLTLQRQMLAPIEAHLEAHPQDWNGAYDVLRMIMSAGHADLNAPLVQQMRRNAEAALRDDGPIITGHRLDPVPNSVEVVIATGETPGPLLGQVASALGRRYGTDVWVIAQAHDHEVYLSAPEVLADAVAEALACRGARLPA